MKSLYFKSGEICVWNLGSFLTVLAETAHAKPVLIKQAQKWPFLGPKIQGLPMSKTFFDDFWKNSGQKIVDMSKSTFLAFLTLFI